MTSFLICNL